MAWHQQRGLRAGIPHGLYDCTYRYNNNLAVWPELRRLPDSTVLYVGPSQFYVRSREHKQASPDTICSTPVYDERLLDYWKIESRTDIRMWWYLKAVMEILPSEGENSFIWNWLMEDGFKPVERKDYPPLSRVYAMILRKLFLTSYIFLNFLNWVLQKWGTDSVYFIK
ncbi:MAG: hypothetical protein ACLVGL_07020 [Waltera sp.]